MNPVFYDSFAKFTYTHVISNVYFLLFSAEHK